MGSAVAVVVVAVVVAALGAEKERGQAEQAAGGEQHRAEIEAGGVHGGTIECHHSASAFFARPAPAVAPPLPALSCGRPQPGGKQFMAASLVAAERSRELGGNYVLDLL